MSKSGHHVRQLERQKEDNCEATANSSLSAVRSTEHAGSEAIAYWKEKQKNERSSKVVRKIKRIEVYRQTKLHLQIENHLKMNPTFNKRRSQKKRIRLDNQAYWERWLRKRMLWRTKLKAMRWKIWFREKAQLIDSTNDGDNSMSRGVTKNFTTKVLDTTQSAKSYWREVLRSSKIEKVKLAARRWTTFTEIRHKAEEPIENEQRHDSFTREKHWSVYQIFPVGTACSVKEKTSCPKVLGYGPKSTSREGAWDRFMHVLIYIATPPPRHRRDVESRIGATNQGEQEMSTKLMLFAEEGEIQRGMEKLLMSTSTFSATVTAKPV